ncbi:hypothetical protein [Aquabacterium sp.]|uniref:hypothetical protein n=1 Tax=Aquabacterium sp. TaxID=1872578 RepID=UPI0019B5499B|nr:hypothetical protein [Aquabacterium sp.]MBC7699758.1 hypothetical protein [Aquabacterium sp.]
MSNTTANTQNYKSKTLATWITLIGGPLGLHRFYLYGFGDMWGWLHPIPTLLGVLGIQRVEQLGQDDKLAWMLIPVLGFTVAYTMLQAIYYGLLADEKWHARFNPSLKGDPHAPASGWAAVIGVVLALLIGATVLMATIAFSGQRYFEYQVDEALKISQ